MLAAGALAVGCAHAVTPSPQAPAPASVVVAEPAPAAASAPGSEEDKTLYALGLIVGNNLDKFTLTPAELLIVQRGIRDAALHNPALVELTDYGPKVNRFGRVRAQAQAAAEKDRGRAYAARLAGDPDTQVFASGLVLRTLTAGSGDTPKDSEQVKVNYRGTLTDGSEFDSSFKRNEPATFPLRNVIPCWTEGLQHMRVGGRARLVCPSSIAYGDGGRPPKIPGGATLTFEVELLAIVKSPAPLSTPATPAAAQPAF